MEFWSCRLMLWDGEAFFPRTKSRKSRIPFHFKSFVCFSHLTARPLDSAIWTMRASGWVGKSISRHQESTLAVSFSDFSLSGERTSKTGSFGEKCLRCQPAPAPSMPIKYVAAGVALLCTTQCAATLAHTWSVTQIAIEPFIYFLSLTPSLGQRVAGSRPRARAHALRQQSASRRRRFISGK